MKRFSKIVVLAVGTSLLAAGPVFAQDLNALNPLGGLGIDLDPFHIFTPAPPPPAPPAPPLAGGGPGPRHHHHRHALARHHLAAHHHSHGGHKHAAHKGAAHPAAKS